MIHSILISIAITYLFYSARELFNDLRAAYDHSPAMSRSERLKDALLAYGHGVMYCSRCSAFWFGLLVTRSMIAAAIASMLIDLYDRIRLKLL